MGRRSSTQGGWILPGLVECLTSIGLGETGPGPAKAMRSPTRSRPGCASSTVWTRSTNVSSRRGAGTTTLMIAPGRANVIGGQAVVVKPRGTTAEEMVLLEPAGVKLTLGEGPKAAFGAKGRLPGTRMGSAYVVRKALLDASEYATKAQGPRGREARRRRESEGR